MKKQILVSVLLEQDLRLRIENLIAWTQNSSDCPSSERKFYSFFLRGHRILVTAIQRKKILFILCYIVMMIFFSFLDDERASSEMVMIDEGERKDRLSPLSTC